MNNPTANVRFKDSNSLNYQRENIYDASEGKKVQHKRYRRCSSNYKGVTYDKARGTYIAQIPHRFKVLKIGRYETAEQAARSYDLKAIEIHGANAILNFPEQACIAV